MSPFFEIEKSRRGGYEVRHLQTGETLSGKVNEETVNLTVLDEESVDYQREEGSVVLEGSEGSVIFDSGGKFLGKRQSGVVYLDYQEAQRLTSLVNQLRGYSPGALQDSLESLWRKTEIDTGKRKPEPWTTKRIVNFLMSGGRTEDFTGKY